MRTASSDPSDQQGRGRRWSKLWRKRGKAIQAPELVYHEVEATGESLADVDAAYDVLFEALARADAERKSISTERH